MWPKSDGIEKHTKSDIGPVELFFWGGERRGERGLEGYRPLPQSPFSFSLVFPSLPRSSPISVGLHRSPPVSLSQSPPVSSSILQSPPVSSSLLQSPMVSLVPTGVLWFLPVS